MAIVALLLLSCKRESRCCCECSALAPEHLLAECASAFFALNDLPRGKASAQRSIVWYVRICYDSCLNKGQCSVAERCRACMQARSRRSVAGKDIMLDPRAGIRKAGAMGPLMALLKEVTEVGCRGIYPCLMANWGSTSNPGILRLL